MGIYKRKQESKIERKHAFDQEKKEKTITVKKKERKLVLGQEKKKKTRSSPRNKEINHDLDQEKKQVLIS